MSKELKVYSSNELFENFETKLSEYIDIKKPSLKERKDHFVAFITTFLSKEEKEQLSIQTDKAIAGFITFSERVFTFSTLKTNKDMCDEFYEMSKYYYNKFLKDVQADVSKDTNKNYESKTEKELLIEIAKKLDKMMGI